MDHGVKGLGGGSVLQYVQPARMTQHIGLPLNTTAAARTTCNLHAHHTYSVHILSTNWHLPEHAPLYGIPIQSNKNTCSVGQQGMGSTPSWFSNTDIRELGNGVPNSPIWTLSAMSLEKEVRGTCSGSGSYFSAFITVSFWLWQISMWNSAKFESMLCWEALNASIDQLCELTFRHPNRRGFACSLCARYTWRRWKLGKSRYVRWGWNGSRDYLAS